RGCFMIGTGVTEAVGDADLRQALGDGLRSFDKAFEDRLRLAQERGEIGRDGDPAALARLASAVMDFLAIRPRAGEPRAVLEAVAEDGVRMICGGAPAPSGS